MNDDMSWVGWFTADEQGRIPFGTGRIARTAARRALTQLQPHTDITLAVLQVDDSWFVVVAS